MDAFTFIQLIISILLIVVIVLQNRGAGAGSAFGASSQSYRSKKGLEKVMFYSTIALAILFASFSILSVLI